MGEEKKLPQVVGYREKNTEKQLGASGEGRRADRCEDGWPGYGILFHNQCIIYKYPIYIIPHIV
jgi:hypothetical protein